MSAHRHGWIDLIFGYNSLASQPWKQSVSSTTCFMKAMWIFTSKDQRWDGESNESVYESCGMGSHANRVNCGVVEWVKRNMLTWFGHIERIHSEEFVTKGYVIKNVGINSRGRLLGRRRDRVREYMCERGVTRGGGLDQARRECLHRERWSLSCCGHPFAGTFLEGARHQSYRKIDS